MKKLIIPFFALALLTASCAKDYSCKCVETFTVDGVVVLTQTDNGPTYEKVTKKWMKNTAGCVSFTETDGNETFTSTCEIEKQ
jgi:hypothetical protein